MTRPPAPPTRIIKRGNGHSYTLDGVKVPGVTTILNKGIPKPALLNWAASTVANFVVDRLTLQQDGTEVHVLADDLIEGIRQMNAASNYPKNIPPTGLPRVALAQALGVAHYADRDAAGKRGTEVHRLAELLARGEEVAVPSELRGHVESYVRFLDEIAPADAILERVVVSRKWSYMGRLDLIAHLELPASSEFPNGFDGLALLDVKTTRSGIFSETALQLAGYRYAETMLSEDGLSEEPMPAVDGCFAVHVRADGYSLIPVEVTPEEHRIFLYAKFVGEWLEGRGRDVVGAEVRP